jgi:thymidylate synthase
MEHDVVRRAFEHKNRLFKLWKANRWQEDVSLYPESQYLSALNRIVREGDWVENKRTGIDCKVIINVDMTYNVRHGALPLVTTRKMGIRTAIGELLGYLRGYTNAEDFAALGAKSWYANANETKAWVNSPHRKGENDCGQIYGAVARNWPKHDGTTIDTLTKIVDNLTNGVDDRGEILSFWNPGMFELGALRPCMYEHQFSLVDGVLHMNSMQRSNDFPIGMCANMVQCYVLLALMARITGHQPGLVYHRSVNCHVYQNQMDLVQEQLERTPYTTPTLVIDERIQTLDDLLTWVTPEHFTVHNYQCYPPIKYPFAS